MKKGYLQVYTGNGKGKTTAAFGLAVRAAGAGMKVWIGQFAKGSEYSEHAALKLLGDIITIKQFGEPAFIRGKAAPNDIANALRGLSEAEEVMKQGKYQVVVLDEACIALHFKLFTMEQLQQAINSRAEHVEIILTGRNAPQELIDAADLVTEMKKVKHPFDEGIPARAGIEF